MPILNFIENTSRVFDSLLVSWRNKATNILSLIIALMQLPGILIMIINNEFPITPLLYTLLIIAYLVALFCAFAIRIDYRFRVWLLIIAGYISSISMTIVIPNGPHMRALPIVLAVVMLVLGGVRPAIVTTLISAAVIIVAPFLHDIPWVLNLFLKENSEFLITGNMNFIQIMGMMALLINTMLLLGFFYNALMETLMAKQQASEALQRESDERIKTMRNLEIEMNKRQHLEYELARISDDERRRFGQDVHDGVCQLLTAARIHCQVLEQRMIRGETMSGTDAHVLSGLLEDALNEAYSIAQGLQSLDSYPEALAQALQSLAKRTKTTAMPDCQFISIGDTGISNLVIAQHLYRIAQEAVSNAVRHAEANKIIISLQCEENEIILRIEDDGIGMSVNDNNDGMGMRTMTFRAQTIGGILTIDSPPAGGLLVICRVPLTGNFSVLNPVKGENNN